MRILAVLALTLFATGPVLAAATPWQDVAKGVRLRLISSDVRAPDGTTLVGLELDMPQTYKTYWRLPGETGIPTEVDIKGSTGLSAPRIQWPYPTPESSNGYLDYVYRGPTVLPVQLKTTADIADLRAAVIMGVCSDICVPVRAEFSLPLSFGSPDAGQSIRLRQALALAPVAWGQPTSPFRSVSLDAAHGLRVALADGTINPGSVIASTSDPTVIFDAPQKSPDGRSILLPLRGADRGLGWAKTPIQLTFMTAMGSYEVSAQVTSLAP